MAQDEDVQAEHDDGPDHDEICESGPRLAIFGHHPRLPGEGRENDQHGRPGGHAHGVARQWMHGRERRTTMAACAKQKALPRAASKADSGTDFPQGRPGHDDDAGECEDRPGDCAGVKPLLSFGDMSSNVARA